ncbi:kyphoscoliosis peptidase-like [Rana temporaria]|uniref:kyphoscoliosis peptidase-like n=1 Tax=Rana temporaria TaxID=8407 RepID=UPI001AACD2E7|nr:kyphoscoliosis peptidase-like [Rana temporaria]
MGRVNSLGPENSQPKPATVKIILAKHDNNNNSYKKCLKVSEAKQDHERIMKAKVESHFSSKSQTLDIQNGNPHEFHGAQTDIHVSTRTSHDVVTEKMIGVLKVSNVKSRTLSTSKSKGQKELFHFWSTKVNGQEDPDREISTVKPRLKRENKNDTVKHSSGSPAPRCDGDTIVPAMTSLKRKKRDEIFSAGAARHIDDHVISMSNQTTLEKLSVQEIVHKITVTSRNCLEKLRAIWIWLCHNISYDIEGFLGRSPKLYRVEDVLESRKGVCAGYAGLCKAMCREIGIQCLEITGFSRGAENSNNDSFHRTKSNHMWNAVELAGQWYLLDACWGAGTVDFEKGVFIPSYDDFFFLTDPEDFINTHWPDDPNWQLLQSVVSFEDFEQRIFKTSEFFRLRLFTISPNVFYLSTENGEVKVSLGCVSPLEFSYKIFKLLNNSRSQVDKSFGILTVHESSMTLHFYPPSAGQFELMVFAKPSEAKDPYKWVCSYQIDCPQPKHPLGLPENPFHFWGLHPGSKDLGVTNCSLREDLIFAENGGLTFTFETSRPLLAMFQLIQPELSETFSKKCLVSQRQDNQLGCHLLLPFWGYYRLSLFVKGQEGDNFQNAANMFINCKNPINHNELFPPNLSVHCGPGTNSKQNGLTSPSHVCPIINTTTGKCNITFHTLWDLEILTSLENNRPNNSLHSLDRYCFITHLEHKISLTVHLPESGHYKLSIFTKRKENEDYCHACDYVIQCASTNRLLPFPKVYNAWGHGCILLQPRYGLLHAESWENFRLKIPGACKVLVIGPVKTELTLTKNKIWEGKVFTGTPGTLLKIAVKFTPNATTMDIVMSFKTQIILDNESSG